MMRANILVHVFNLVENENLEGKKACFEWN